MNGTLFRDPVRNLTLNCWPLEVTSRVFGYDHSSTAKATPLQERVLSHTVHWRLAVVCTARHRSLGRQSGGENEIFATSSAFLHSSGSSLELLRPFQALIT
jgi:hypothetical protein